MGSQINKALFDVVMYGFTNYTKSQVVPHADAIFEALVDLMTEDDEFIDAIYGSTSELGRVKTRFGKWLAVLEEIVDSPPQKRVFTRTWKEQLWKDNKVCSLCGQTIMSIDDAAVHHVKHYWRGGPTTPKQ